MNLYVNSLEEIKFSRILFQLTFPLDKNWSFYLSVPKK